MIWVAFVFVLAAAVFGTGYWVGVMRGWQQGYREGRWLRRHHDPQDNVLRWRR